LSYVLDCIHNILHTFVPVTY